MDIESLKEAKLAMLREALSVLEVELGIQGALGVSESQAIEQTIALLVDGSRYDRARCYEIIGMERVRDSLQRDIVDLEDEIYLEEKGEI
jgi:hypothetical protein